VDDKDEVEKAKVDLDKYRGAARNLAESAEIDRGYHVLEIADRSKDGKVVYIDEHVPDRVCGVDTSVSLAIHELAEWLAMNDGMKYLDAHTNVATVLEREYVGTEKWDRYQKEFDKYEHEIEDIDESDVPKDIDLRVYEGKELAFMRRMIGDE
jgi:hypothetical protein